jgi:hypothetical protein
MHLPILILRDAFRMEIHSETRKQEKLPRRQQFRDRKQACPRKSKAVNSTVFVLHPIGIKQKCQPARHILENRVGWQYIAG